MKRLALHLALFILALGLGISTSNTWAKQSPKTKLVVVISYDQMRGDYIERFNNILGDRGFKRLMKDGAHSPLCYYNHISNMTCPGHATLLTGCYPSKTGIVSNDFFDSPSACMCYCVEDKKSPSVGNEKLGRSPALIKTPSLSDYLAKSYPKSKTVSLALKDRAAILMSGFNTKNSVLWFDWKINAFTTSTYYKKPEWLQALNTAFPYDAYQQKTWNTIIPDSLGYEDSVRYEGKFPGGDNTFPHELGNKEQKSYAEALLTSPYGIEFLFNASKFAIEHAGLGQDNQPDMLTIGVSTTDFLGHTFGPDSRELQELYVHADNVLADFLTYLDNTIGKQSYTIVITSDHGVGPIPEYVQSFGKVPVDAGRINESECIKSLEQSLSAMFGADPNTSWISIFEPPSLFLNDSVIQQQGLKKSHVIDALCTVMQQQQGIALAVPTSSIQQGRLIGGWTKEMLEMYRNAIYPERTGDIMFMTKPYWVWGPKPATHGTPYDYDTYVPLMFYGAGIPVNATIKGKTEPVDIAPTLANILDISMKNIHGKILDISGKEIANPEIIPPKNRKKK